MIVLDKKSETLDACEKTPQYMHAQCVFRHIGMTKALTPKTGCQV